MDEEDFNKWFIRLSILISTLVMFIFSLWGALLDPPNGGYMMSGASFLLIYSGALVLVAVFAFIAGYFQINDQTRRFASRIFYLACLLSFYLCIILYYNVLFADIWRDASFYASYYVLFFLISTTVIFPLLLLFLVLVNRLFIALGTRISSVTVN